MYKYVTFSAKHIVVTDGLEIQILYILMNGWQYKLQPNSS